MLFFISLVLGFIVLSAVWWVITVAFAYAGMLIAIAGVFIALSILLISKLFGGWQLSYIETKEKTNIISLKPLAW